MVPADVAGEAVGIEFRRKDQFYLVEITAQFQSEFPVLLRLLRETGAHPQGLIIKFIRVIGAQAERSALLFVLPGPVQGRIKTKAICMLRSPCFGYPGLGCSRMIIDAQSVRQGIFPLMAVPSDPFSFQP